MSVPQHDAVEHADADNLAVEPAERADGQVDILELVGNDGVRGLVDTDQQPERASNAVAISPEACSEAASNTRSRCLACDGFVATRMTRTRMRSRVLFFMVVDMQMTLCRQMR